MVQRLWGDNFFDAQERVWKKHNQGANGKTLKRGFVEFILEPIIKVYKLIQAENKEKVVQILTNLNITLTKEQHDLTGRAFRKAVFSSWLPVQKCLINMIESHLPSPVEAMQYRTDILLDGPQDSDTYKAMKACDPNGPLVMYVSKMVPNKDYSRFYAFGRIFAGTLKAGKVTILDSNFTKEQGGYHEKSISSPMLMLGK